MQAAEADPQPHAGTQGSARSLADQADLLFQPWDLGQFALKHRIVYAPLTRCRALDPGNLPGDNMLEYYSQRARGCEGGLIIAEATSISATGHGYPFQPGIYTKDQISAWTRIVKEVKSHGASFFLQIWHGGRVSHTDYQPDGAAPLSPVRQKAEGDCYLENGTAAKYSEPQALDKAGIRKLIDEFRQAAANAMEAGFDGVELHGANGYIIDQFIKPHPNQRTDEYGGSIENRCRIVSEIVDAVVQQVGAQRVGIRLSPYNQDCDVRDDQPNETNSFLTEQLNKFGLLYIHFVEPRVINNFDSLPRDDSHDTQIFRKIWKGTFMAAGGYNKENAIEALRLGHLDLVCLGRHYLANPDLPRRWREGAPLNKYDRPTFYSQGNQGYLDYPFMDGVPDSAAKFLT